MKPASHQDPVRDDFGLHFLIGLSPGYALQDKDKYLLTKLRPAGIILFAENFNHGAAYDAWLADLRSLLAAVRGCIGREKILVCIDHEGGRVVRTPPPITRFGYARHWRDQAHEVGTAMGVELRSLGVNVNFAPVIDIHSNPANPIIGERAFGSEPETVIESANHFLEGLQKAGVWGCLKHFPGHGDTALDSHLALPIVDRTEAVLRARELLPFARMARSGAPFLMTGHILYPQADTEPATLSRRFLTDILRGEFGYEGLVLSDDLGMAAVAKRFEDPQAIITAFNAGCDIFLVCAALTDTTKALDLADYLKRGHQKGAIASKDLATSRRKIATVLAKTPQLPVISLPLEIFQSHHKLTEFY